MPGLPEGSLVVPSSVSGAVRGYPGGRASGPEATIYHARPTSVHLDHGCAGTESFVSNRSISLYVEFRVKHSHRFFGRDRWQGVPHPTRGHTELGHVPGGGGVLLEGLGLLQPPGEMHQKKACPRPWDFMLLPRWPKMPTPRTRYLKLPAYWRLSHPSLEIALYGNMCSHAFAPNLTAPSPTLSAS